MEKKRRYKTGVAGEERVYFSEITYILRDGSYRKKQIRNKYITRPPRPSINNDVVNELRIMNNEEKEQLKKEISDFMSSCGETFEIKNKKKIRTPLSVNDVLMNIRKLKTKDRRQLHEMLFKCEE